MTGAQPRMMHLGMILLGAGSHVAGWRMPGAEFGSGNLPLLQRIVARAETAKFDVIVLADTLNTGLISRWQQSQEP